MADGLESTSTAAHICPARYYWSLEKQIVSLFVAVLDCSGVLVTQTTKKDKQNRQKDDRHIAILFLVMSFQGKPSISGVI